MKTKFMKLNWGPIIFIIGIVIFSTLATVDWLTEGFTTVGPFLG